MELSHLIGFENSCTEKEMEGDILTVSIPPQDNAMPIKETPNLSTRGGQIEPKETEGALGPRILGPTESVTKVYVRRKEVLASRGKAFCFNPVVNPIPALLTDSTSTSYGAIMERQFDLVKELGLTHGEDDSKIKELMRDMDTNDNKVAVEMGSKYHQL